MRDIVLLIEQIEAVLPRAPVNERTAYVCRQHWVERHTVADIAAHHGWSVPAVEWHLRRAERVLNTLPR